MHVTSPRPWTVGIVAALFATPLAPRPGAGQGVPSSDACVTCHADLEDEAMSRPVTDYETDLHAALGFGCLDCHGPDASAQPDPTAGFLSKPDRRNVSGLCGRCHSDAQFMRQYDPAFRIDQEAEYANSVHGQRLAEFGDPNVAVCVSCHPAHRILPPSDPESTVHPLNVATTCGTCHEDEAIIGSYDIPMDQHDAYRESVHWEWMEEEGDLSAPTCNDCHGNHGAAPPGVSSVLNVCGQCHTVMAEFFNEGVHAEPFVEHGLPGCATCHGNHDIVTFDDEMLLTMSDSVCAQCHAQGEVGADDYVAMKSMIDSLILELDRSRAVLTEAANAGMEVSEAQFTLDEVTTALIKARTATHTFVADSVQKEVEIGLAVAASAFSRGQDALDEHLFRRQGLAVSVGLILLFVLGLALKIRQIERGRSFAAPHTYDEG